MEVIQQKPSNAVHSLVVGQSDIVAGYFLEESDQVFFVRSDEIGPFDVHLQNVNQSFVQRRVGKDHGLRLDLLLKRVFSRLTQLGDFHPELDFLTAVLDFLRKDVFVIGQNERLVHFGTKENNVEPAIFGLEEFEGLLENHDNFLDSLLFFVLQVIIPRVFLVVLHDLSLQILGEVIHRVGGDYFLEFVNLVEDVEEGFEGKLEEVEADQSQQGKHVVVGHHDLLPVRLRVDDRREVHVLIGVLHDLEQILIESTPKILLAQEVQVSEELEELVGKVVLLDVDVARVDFVAHQDHVEKRLLVSWVLVEEASNVFIEEVLEQLDDEFIEEERVVFEQNEDGQLVQHHLDADLILADVVQRGDYFLLLLGGDGVLVFLHHEQDEFVDVRVAFGLDFPAHFEVPPHEVHLGLVALMELVFNEGQEVVVVELRELVSPGVIFEASHFLE